MLTLDEVRKLREVQKFTKLSWVFGKATGKELLDTTEAALLVVEEAKKLPSGTERWWIRLERALKPFKKWEE